MTPHTYFVKLLPPFGSDPRVWVRLPHAPVLKIGYSTNLNRWKAAKSKFRASDCLLLGVVPLLEAFPLEQSIHLFLRKSRSKSWLGSEVYTFDVWDVVLGFLEEESLYLT